MGGILVISRKLVDLEDGETRFTAEASTLGLKPGQWPDMIVIADVNPQHITEPCPGMLFNRRGAFDRNGEFAGCTYHSDPRDEAHYTAFTVFND